MATSAEHQILGIMMILDAITRNLDNDIKQEIKKEVQERLDMVVEGEDGPIGWILTRYLTGSGFSDI